MLFIRDLQVIYKGQFHYPYFREDKIGAQEKSWQRILGKEQNWGLNPKSLHTSSHYHLEAGQV